MSVSGTDQGMQGQPSGRLGVDGDTAQLINSKVADVQSAVSAARAAIVDAGATATPLGHGYAQRIGQRNGQVANGGPGSAADTLARFAESLDDLKNAVVASIGHYQGADGAGRHWVEESGRSA
ncbi:MAG: hypothetical protein JOZ47_02490 [Kutzneria sp.]|nr:hypothetical protein [Kutzneria sp.]